jgi:hypothetical protein
MIESQLAEAINKLRRDVNDLLTRQSRPAGAVDYSGTSVVVGWSSTTFKEIRYARNGKRVDVIFNIQGTSNSTSTSFSLPYTPTGVGVQVLIKIRDNSGNRVVGQAVMPVGSTTVLLVPNILSAGDNQWTASGTKEVYGQFFFYIE